MKVVLNVYDLDAAFNARYGDKFGLGLYHTGVEIDGVEYQFGGNTQIRDTGVYMTLPRGNPQYTYKLSIELGEIPIDDLRNQENNQRKGQIDFDEDILPVIEDLER